MLYLIGSIVLTSYLTLTFKLMGRFGINAFQAIVFNYCTCVITGSIVNHRFPINMETGHERWFPWALLMGCMFIGIFNILGYTAQKIGVAVASVANKISLVIPFLFSVYLYAEKTNFFKITGIVIALVAVVLTCIPPAAPSSKPVVARRPGLLIMLPGILFISSGLLDTLIKYVEQGYLDGNNNNEFLITAFAVAATIGLAILSFRAVQSGKTVKFRNVVAGICIGVPNYFSIWCLVKVLKDYTGRSSAIIPVNNMGIVLFSAIMAWLLFKEKLSVANWLGIVLSVGAIALIAFG